MAWLLLSFPRPSPWLLGCLLAPHKVSRMPACLAISPKQRASSPAKLTGQLVDLIAGVTQTINLEQSGSTG